MSRRLKVLGRVRDARLKQRDVAAAEASRVEALEHAAERQKDAAFEALDALLEQSGARLAAADGIRALLQLEAERHSLVDHLGEMAHAYDQAIQKSHVARSALRDYERALRTSDKLIEREEHGIDKVERRDEQRATDDYVAGRRSA